MNDDVLICRCQEITRGEIIQAIHDGATTVDGVKRRTRACMGLCQGKTCERLIQGIIAEETEKNRAEIQPQKTRMPVRPLKLSVLGGSEKDEV